MLWSVVVKRIMVALLTTFLSFYIFFQYSFNNILILEPVKNQQEHMHRSEKLLILVGGGNCQPSSFLSLAKSIQRMCDHYDLWIVIPQFFMNIPNSMQARAKLGQSIRLAQLRGAFKGRNVDIASDVFVGAYSVGGIATRQVVHEDRYAGLILFASYLSRTSEANLFNYSTPVLTITGELDGLVRVTRMALAVSDFQKMVSKVGIEQAARRVPIAIVPGLSHTQFGEHKPRRKDIIPELELSEAHHTIATLTSTFISSMDDSSKWPELAKWSNDSFDLVNGFLKTIEVEHSGWCQMSQGKELQNGTNVNVDSLLTFVRGHQQDHNMTSFSHQAHPFNPFDFSSIPVATQTLRCKMIITSDLPDQQQECKQMNLKAIDFASQLIAPRSLNRYLTKGKRLQILEDVQKSNLISWMMSPLSFDMQTGKVSSSHFVDHSTGYHYCTLLSPSRIAEWMMVDSLPKQTPP